MNYQISVSQCKKTSKWIYEIDDKNGFLVADDGGFYKQEDAQRWAESKLEEIEKFRGE